MKYAALKTYSFKTGPAGSLADELLGDDQSNSPSEELDRLAKAQMHAHPQMDYHTAVQRVMSAHPELARVYASETGGRVRIVAAKPTSSEDPSVPLANKASELVASGKCKTYSEAARQALRESPVAGNEWTAYSSM